MMNVKGLIFWGSQAQVWINAGGGGVDYVPLKIVD